MSLVFFGRKSNNGRVLKQVWGFGFVERETGRLFVEVVPKRDKKTLIPIIQKWISKNTMYVITDAEVPRIHGDREF